MNLGFAAFLSIAVTVTSAACSHLGAHHDARYSFEVSYIQLLSHPERFHGKRIEVRGFANIEYEGTALLLDREYAEGGLPGIWIDFEDGVNPLWPPGVDFPEDLRKFHGGYVVVVATFDMYSHGHFGAYLGTLRKVEKIADASERTPDDSSHWRE
jgi:hypothetical protein